MGNTSLLENILRYADCSLEKIMVDGRAYRTVHHEPTVIIGAAFGTTSCNERLAQSAKDAREYFGKTLPAILQKEIFDFYSLNFGADNTYFVGTDDNKGASLVKSEIDTRGVLQGAQAIMNHLELDSGKVLYVAHPAHMQRVMDVGKKLGLKGEPFVENRVRWSDAYDRQRWTTSSPKWALRELLARAHHKYKGYV